MRRNSVVSMVNFCSESVILIDCIAGIVGSPTWVECFCMFKQTLVILPSGIDANAFCSMANLINTCLCVCVCVCVRACVTIGFVSISKQMGLAGGEYFSTVKASDCRSTGPNLPCTSLWMKVTVMPRSQSNIVIRDEHGRG